MCPADRKQTLIGVAKAFREQVPGANSYLMGQNEDVYPGPLNPTLGCLLLYPVASQLNPSMFSKESFVSSLKSC